MEIRKLSDFLEIPEGELHRCLNSFRMAVLKAKADRMALQQNGKAQEGINFDSFVWRQNVTDETLDLGLHPATPVDELPIRHKVKTALKNMNVFALEDLSEVTESELLMISNSGRITVEKLRSMLAKIGLMFKSETDPAQKLQTENRLARRLPAADRLKSVTNESSVSELGLKQSTLERALRNGHLTVDHLRALSPRDLLLSYGNKQLEEIVTIFSQAGVAFHNPLSNLDLWWLGLLKRDDLPYPTDPNAGIGEAAPWLGSSVVERLKKCGVDTLQALSETMRRPDSVARLRFGPKTRTKINEFLQYVG